MNRKHLVSLFSAAAIAALTFTNPASAARVEIQVSMPDGSGVQSFTLTVPENCARTDWPAFVLSCQTLDEAATPGGNLLPTYVIAPSGRVFNIALASANGEVRPSLAGGGILLDQGHPGDDIARYGRTVDGGSSIWIARDENGRAQRAYLLFEKDSSFARFKRGETGDELAVAWSTLKARYN